MSGLELLSDQGYRIDGRKPSELRKIECRLGVFSQADGSAYLEQGNTKVLAAVYGPHEVRGGYSKALHDKALINCQYSMATFSTTERKRQPRGDRRSQEMSMQLEQTFESAIKTELYPKSQIDIFVEVLQSDGGNYCACVNASTLAIIDAGIPMRDYVAACNSGFVKDTPLVDISYVEEGGGGPAVTVATLPRSGQVVLVQMTSRLHINHLETVMDTAVKGCKDIFDIMERSVRDHATQLGSSLGWE